jgi:Na+-driven multidrug efflux pump
MTLKNQCISTAGINAVAAMNIQTTITNVLNIAYLAQGSAIAIILGNMLGAGKTKEAKEDSVKLLTFAALSGVAMGVLQILISPFVPMLYNTSAEVKELATYMMVVTAICMVANSLAVATYYTLRSGGLAILTFLFDCGYAWMITVPVALILAYVVGADIKVLFFAVTLAECSKCLLGLFLTSKVNWARKIT